MTVEPDDPSVDRRTLALVTLGTVAVSVVVAFGFSAASTNPITPEATVEIADAEDDYRLDEPGTVELVTISHVDGEGIPVSDLRIVFGSQSSGPEFAPATNWSVAVGDVQYRMLYDGRPVRNDTQSPVLHPGESLTVAKTSGTVTDPPQNATTTVRVFHTPSQTVVASSEVTFR
ncbi:hypothetical protein [Halosimplex amylolyticum]|uniref:hypothetical protein n=1 Tax=Halosimplex amylolyticum TaxID=3396616 RepID=UPI003F55AE4A